MNRIAQKFTTLATQQKKVLSPYITAGDPHPEQTVSIMHELVKSGADIIELGIPFSDPMAEGVVIQAAMERALVHGVTTDDVLAMVKSFRTTDSSTPVVLMGYLNPIEQYGYEAFASAAVSAGVDGVIIVDLPPEECDEIAPLFHEYHLNLIFLCSPTTTAHRMALIQQYAQGYIYYVSLKGVTGSAAMQVEEVREQYQKRRAMSQLPVVVGFGIKTPEHAAEVASFADGVVVGAAVIDMINQHDIAAGKTLIANMRQAMDKRVTE